MPTPFEPVHVPVKFTFGNIFCVPVKFTFGKIFRGMQWTESALTEEYSHLCEYIHA
jgi:hypothetical protein